MTQSWSSWYWKRAGASSFVVAIAIAFFADCAKAQIAPDDTLGAESSAVTPNVVINGIPSHQIDGGAIRGANLFHSFDKFSIPTGGAAYFNNALNIKNIISRVTGKSISNIDGLLRANGTANLFLLNPNGIIFGSNARLAIGGSFLASTASSLNFADGTQFNATVPQTTPLLRVSVPIGLQFGRNPGSILVEGNGEGLRSDGDPIIDPTVGLGVQSNQTLAMVGGDVALTGGTLKTAGGRIELGSVAGSSLVSLTPTASGFALGYSGVQNFGDIQLSQQAAVDASGVGGGEITVWGRRVTLSNGSQIEASTLGSEPGGTLTVDASELVELIGSSADGQFATALAALVYPRATGAGGNLTLETGQLIVRDGAVISTVTSGQGKGGNLTVTASDSVELLRGSVLYTETKGVPDAGDLTITTRQLSVGDGAWVSASTSAEGDGGNLAVTASDSVKLFRRSGLFAQTQGAGDAGDLKIATQKLSVADGSVVSAFAYGQGNSGDIKVVASNSVNLFGVSSEGSSSGLFTRTERGGQGGDITVNTSAFRIANGAVVDARTLGSGNGGNITANANTFEAVNGGQVLTTTRSSGHAGNISLNVTESVTLSGSDPTYRDRLNRFPDQVDNEGAGAGIAVNSLGQGNAGNLRIQAGSVTLESGAFLTAETASGSGGNIILKVQDLLLMRHNGNISSTAGTAKSGGDGGNIVIDTGFLVAVPSENSDITANAFQGRGGNIQIATQDIFGTQFREQLTPESDVTASSDFGLNGVVEINTPDVDLSQGLVTLPAELVDASGLIASGCKPAGWLRQSEFIITGRGGLPANPSDTLSSDTVWSDLRTQKRAGGALSGAAPPPLIVEASGWMINNEGEVVLTASAPNVTPHIPWLSPATCHTLEPSS